MADRLYGVQHLHEPSSRFQRDPLEEACAVPLSAHVRARDPAPVPQHADAPHSRHAGDVDVAADPTCPARPVLCRNTSALGSALEMRGWLFHAERPARVVVLALHLRPTRLLRQRAWALEVSPILSLPTSWSEVATLSVFDFVAILV